MENFQTKDLTYKFEFLKNNEKLVFDMSQKDNKIHINIIRDNSIQNSYYYKEFFLEELQKIGKYFKVFDLIEDVFIDLKYKFEQKTYEVNLEHIESKIITIYSKINFFYLIKLNFLLNLLYIFIGTGIINKFMIY